ncbi:hypothetical protein [Gordonia sp. N1V]|uniref:hypothetical protein n=1 Tax=Gordonia sp. N1V TaxID=3034163 RepID=UPI0023E19457|nr:hypothetical protein [Gordonia sp. N1V]MDF3280858.1 hypothetical protein [Gordonia sp. N1V]
MTPEEHAEQARALLASDEQRDEAEVPHLSPQEHYAVAEKLAHEARNRRRRNDLALAGVLLAQAQVHATLATTAATPAYRPRKEH